MRFLRNLFTAASAQLGRLGRWLVGRDPIAVARQTVENATDNVGQYAGMIEGKRREVSRLTEEEAVLTAKGRAAAKNNDEVKATEFAGQLSVVRGKLAQSQASLARYESSYGKAVKNVGASAKAIAEKERALRELEHEAKASQIDADMAEMHKSLSSNAVDSILSGVSSREEELRNRIDANRGKAKALNDLSEGTDEYAQAVETQAVSDILDEFRK